MRPGTCMYFFNYRAARKVAEPNAWDQIGLLCQSKDIGSAQSPSKLERECVQVLQPTGRSSASLSSTCATSDQQPGTVHAFEYMTVGC